MQSPAQVDFARRASDGNETLSTSAIPYAPGDLIGGSYVVVARLAGAAEDVVFSCCDEKSGEQVAIKPLLHPTPDRLQRLKSEFRELQERGRSGLPRGYSLHVSEREAFIVMELREGLDYGRVLRAEPSGGEALAAYERFAGAGEEAPLPLIGRSAELDALRRVSRLACSDGGRVLMLWGASGMGKTRLLGELGAEWRERGDWVLQGRCYPSEFVPFASLDGVMDALRHQLLRLPPAERSVLAQAEFQILAQAFPVLDGLVGQGARRNRRDLGRNVGQLGGALRALFTRLVRDRPIAVLVDDAQWGDQDGWRVLSRLWQEPLPRGLLLVLALRDEGSIAADVRREVGAVEGVEQLSLGPLAQSSCVELARRAGMPFEGEEQPSLLGLGGGNPNWVIHLARAARSVERPRSLQEAVALRWAGVGAGGRFVLKLLAVAGGPLPESIVRHALDGDGEFHRDVGALRSAGLVVAHRTSRGDAALDFDHDSTRAGVLELLEADERSPLLARLARSVETERRASSSPIAEYHLGAGDPARATESALVAAAKASEQLAFARAARLYEIALRHGCADPAERSAVLRRLGESMVAAGHGLRGAERIIEGAQLAPDSGEALKLRALGVEHLFRCAEHGRAIEHLGPLLRSMGLTRRRLQPLALTTLLGLRGRLWLQRRRGGRGGDPSVDARLRMDVLWSLGVGLSLYDPLNAFILQVRHALLAEQQGSPEHIALARATESFIMAWEGGEPNRRRSRRALAAAEELGQLTSEPRVRAHLYVMSAGIAITEERARDVLEVTSAGLSYCEEFCPQAHWEIAQLASLRAVALLHAGRVPEMCEWVCSALGAAEQGEDRLARLLLRGGFCALAWIAAGRADQLEEELAAAERTPLRGYYRFQHQWACAALALASRQTERACRLAEEAYATCRSDFLFRLRTVRIDMHDLRARCALTLAARSGSDLLLDRAAASIRKLEKEGGDWPAGLAAANAALFALHRGRLGVAREKMAEAKICFERGGMRLHVHAARTRLAELTGQPVDPPDGWRLWLEDGGSERLPGIIDAVLAPLGARALP